MSLDFTKMGVDDIRKLLVERGMSQEEANSIKGKSLLVEKYGEIVGGGVINEDANFDAISYTEEQSPIVHISEGAKEGAGYTTGTAKASPLIGTQEWQDLVLDGLHPDEYEEKDGKKHPKANGLRRQAQLLLGPIIRSGPVTIFPPQGPTNLATVLYQITFRWEYDKDSFVEERTFSEVADASTDNTPAPFNVHPSATASSRAEGRALRKALQLNIATAEEMNAPARKSNSISDGMLDLQTPSSSASDAQLSTIKTLSSRLNIELPKALEFHSMNPIEKLTYEEAQKLLSKFSEYQSNSGDSAKIPDVIKKSL